MCELPTLTVDAQGDICSPDQSPWLVSMHAELDERVGMAREVVRRINGWDALTAERDRYRAELERIAATPARCTHVGRLTAEVRQVLRSDAPSPTVVLRPADRATVTVEAVETQAEWVDRIR